MLSFLFWQTSIIQNDTEVVEGIAVLLKQRQIWEFSK